jgi:Fe-S cluster biogenesis protein NfuA
MIYMEKPSAGQATEEKIREIIDSLECVLTKHDSCAEFIEFKDNTAVIFCGGPCKNCDNRCIEEAIKGRFPDLEVIIS